MRSVMREQETGLRGRARLWIGAALFLLLSLMVFWGITKILGQGIPRFDQRLVQPQSLGLIGAFLVAYFLSDGMRLHFVLRTLDAQVSFRQVMPLVFVNIFFSNITPMATGGGFAQIFYLQRHGVTVGLAAAATTIRTILAMLAIFIAAPLFLIAAPAVNIGGGQGGLVSSITVVIALYLTGFVVLLLRPDWLAVIGTLSVVTFLMYFAPTPGGAGFSELAFAGLMAGRIEPSQLVLMIAAWRFFTIYLGMAIGAVVSIVALRPRAAKV